MTVPRPVAVVTLANDAVAPWLEAFARSLRLFSPEVTVQVLPFDGRLAEVRRICKRFDFRLQSEGGLERFDAIGSAVLGPGHPMKRTFRKLAAFESAPGDFLFLDADVVVLDRVERLLDAFAPRSEQLGYFDTDPEKVYRAGEFRNRMTRLGGSIGFITGSFLSRRGAVTCEVGQAAAIELAESLEELSGPYEQPFLNYCFDRTNMGKVAMGSLIDGLGGNWAGDPNLRKRLMGRSWRALLEQPRVPFVHWAGLELKYRMPCGAVYLAFASIVLPRSSAGPG